MSLIPPHEMEDIFLPPTTNIIKDLRISPSNGSLALFASMGKKLSLLRCMNFLNFFSLVPYLYFFYFSLLM